MDNATTLETPSMCLGISTRYKKIRAHSERLCAPLQTEDYTVQPIVDVSPPKWHLAHCTWFFEQFILVKYLQGYNVFHDDFAFLFNSYYNNMGKRLLRPNRGLMTRPSVDEVYAYRQYVDEAMLRLLASEPSEEAFGLIEIGLNHEQQHQELLAYDIKYILGHQPLFPSFDFPVPSPLELKKPMGFISLGEGVYDIGHKTTDFCYDNELGQHKVYLHDFEIADRLVTNQEFMEFMEDGGYENFNLWHAGRDGISSNHKTSKAPCIGIRIPMGLGNIMLSMVCRTLSLGRLS